MTVSVRTMKPDEIDAVIALYDELDRFHHEQLPDLFQPPTVSVRTEAFFGAILQDDKSDILVAETDRVVGFAEIKLVPALDIAIFKPQLRALIDAIFIAPESRRKGVAQSLMQACERWAKERGAVGIDLGVYEFNEGAQDLFLGGGFSTSYRRMSKPLA